MDIKSVSVTLDKDDLRVMASALRLYHRTCAASVDDKIRLMKLVHLAERADTYEAGCFASNIGTSIVGPLGPPEGTA